MRRNRLLLAYIVLDTRTYFCPHTLDAPMAFCWYGERMLQLYQALGGGILLQGCPKVVDWI